MKKIVVACGSGVATSTAVNSKIKDLLDSNGLAGTYHIVQCAIAEADLLVATTVPPADLKCDFVSGLPFLTGMGRADAEKKIVEIVSK